ncbi:hypothetical protein L1887_13307 [Cichorium endivia]|nr:hypothetical protein L1887_13307 [Cichorium endivia]
MKSWTEWFCWVDSGDIAEFSFDRIAWLTIIGIPAEFWSEENFTKTGESFGKVVVPYTFDLSAVDFSAAKIGIISNSKLPIVSEVPVTINGKVVMVGVSEVDLDWSPFSKKSTYLSDEQSSEDNDDEIESDSDDDGISDTVPMNSSNDVPEEGEIVQDDDDVEVVEDSCAPAGNTAVIVENEVQTPEMIPDLKVVSSPNKNCNNENRELQRSRGEFTPPLENMDVENSEKINDDNDANSSPPGIQLGPTSFGPLENLAKSGCFGPFPINNTLGPHDNSPFDIGLNFSNGNMAGKRRRIFGSDINPSLNISDHPRVALSAPFPNPLDLNEDPIPSTIPLPDSDTESTTISSEIRKTAMVGQILGFDIEAENPILKEVMEIPGEINVPQ